MKIKDLIKNKDYDCILYSVKRSTLKRPIFGGAAASKNGKLISLDGVTIPNEEDDILEYEEWSRPIDNIKNGVTIIVNE